MLLFSTEFDTGLLTNPEDFTPAIKERLQMIFIDEGMSEKFGISKSEIQKKNMDGALDLIKSARSLLSSQEIEQENTVETRPAPIADAVKNLILSARKQFQDGNVLGGVTSILDALLLFNPSNVGL